ncbi:MAG: hypothetical protein ACC651_16280 [Candidatus Scalindua sp.]
MKSSENHSNMDKCPVCGYAANSKEFITKKQNVNNKWLVLESVIYECPSCHTELSIANVTIWKWIGLLIPILFVASYIADVPANYIGYIGIAIGIAAAVFLMLKKSGLIRTRFLPKNK